MNFDNLHQILRSLYEQMMPLCGDMAGVAKGIAGLGALFYVAYRVWQSLARAEPIDVFPMLRPFAIGLCIMFFPTVVLGTINSIMSPVVQGTAKMLEAETLDMNRYREQKDKLEYEAMMRNPETAYLVSNEEFDKQLEELGWSPGDMVTMAGMYIEFRSTRIRTFPNALVIVPNSSLVSSPITNWSRMNKRRASFSIGLTYDTPKEKMETCVSRITEMVNQNPEIIPEDTVIRFNSFKDSNLEISLVFFTRPTSFADFQRIKEAVNYGIMQIVEEEGLSFAFPTQTLYVNNLSK